VNNNYNVIEAWIKENSNLIEIKDTIRRLTKDKYHEYSRDLEEMSKLEGQSAILKIASEIPEFFSWNSYQIQNKRIGFIKASRYMQVFKEKKGKWPYIPVFEYTNEKCSIVINLHFNGHYHLKTTRMSRG